MGIAIDFVMDSSPRQNAVLIPEIAFLIQKHLQPHDLAVASRVCRSWQEGWTPFLYYSVRYHNHQSQHYTNSLFINHPYNQSLSDQQIVPFLNLTKYGYWIKCLEVSNLIITHNQYSHQSSYYSPNGASLSPTSPISSPPFPPVQDHLFQIQTCNSLNLTQLSILKTVMSLERLDQLLISLPTLKIFKFEIVNNVESTTKSSASSSLHSRTHSGSSITRGSSQQGGKKLMKMSLQDLEQEVVRVIARRLHRTLEKLELILTVPGTVVVSAFEELLAYCGPVLKTLSLTKMEITQRDYKRGWNSSFEAEITALLASLLDTSISSSTPAYLQGQSPMSSTPGTLSSSSSSSSISSAFYSPALSISNKPNPPKGIPILESLSLISCNVTDREFGNLLQKIPNLRELCINDCKSLNRHMASSVLTHTPQLESLLLSSVSSLTPESLVELFTTTTTTEEQSESGAPEIPGVNTHRSGLQLKNVRLAYLRQLDDNIMKTIALHQGPSLVKLSLHWCPHVTDHGITPIFESCGQLKDLSICLSKPTVSIFSEIIDPTSGAKKDWACSHTLERLEIGGQMFLDRIRASNAHLQPQLYHHTSPNPHHIRNGSSPQFTAGGTVNGIVGTVGSNSSNIIHDPYAVAHHQGYPMYHLWRYNRFSDPFRELQAQLETLPRLKHLGISSKGVEHLIRKGFGPKVHLDSLALLNQQGRVWDPEEVEDLLKHMPELRNIICEKNTILVSSQPAQVRKDAKLYKQQQRVANLLLRHNVELVQAS